MHNQRSPDLIHVLHSELSQREKIRAQEGKGLSPPCLARSASGLTCGTAHCWRLQHSRTVCNPMCPSKLPQSCRKQKVMTAQYCGQPVRLAAPRPPLLFSLFSLVLYFPASSLPSLLSFLWKWASVHNDLQPHPQGTKRKENRSIASGRWRESDKQEDRGVTVARRRRRGEDDLKKKKKKKPHAEVRKMENLSSLGSQQSAELDLTRKMSLHPLSHQSD